jgi:hypothetical protein
MQVNCVKLSAIFQLKLTLRLKINSSIAQIFLAGLREQTMQMTLKCQ